MDVYEAIKKRYSVRAYKDAPVEDDKLQRILEAGCAAPSSRNTQAWKLVVVRDPHKRQRLADAASMGWLAGAPVILVIVSTAGDHKMYCGVPSGPVDCAIVIDHITLAAVAEGLGTCWVGHFEQETCLEVLGVDDGGEIIELLALGYPQAARAHAERKSLDELVCYDTYVGSGQA